MNCPFLVIFIEGAESGGAHIRCNTETERLVLPQQLKIHHIVSHRVLLVRALCERVNAGFCCATGRREKNFAQTEAEEEDYGRKKLFVVLLQDDRVVCLWGKAQAHYQTQFSLFHHHNNKGMVQP